MPEGNSYGLEKGGGALTVPADVEIDHIDQKAGPLLVESFEVTGEDAFKLIEDVSELNLGAAVPPAQGGVALDVDRPQVEGRETEVPLLLFLCRGRKDSQTHCKPDNKCTHDPFHTFTLLAVCPHPKGCRAP